VGGCKQWEEAGRSSGLHFLKLLIHVVYYFNVDAKMDAISSANVSKLLCSALVSGWRLRAGLFAELRLNVPQKVDSAVNVYFSGSLVLT
jgi:hypothetical protein